MCNIEGMGSEIPIKITGELKTMKWVLSYAGESCSHIVVRKITGGKKKICLPLRAARIFAPFFGWSARIRGTRPLYTKYALYTLSSNGYFSHDKATCELGYQPRSMEATVRDTVLWIKGEDVPLETMW